MTLYSQIKHFDWLNLIQQKRINSDRDYIVRAVDIVCVCSDSICYLSVVQMIMFPNAHFSPT